MEKPKRSWIENATPKKSVKNRNFYLNNKDLIQETINLSQIPNNYLIADESKVIELCNNFNENVIQQINPSYYDKYANEIRNLEKSAYNFVTFEKKDWRALLCNMLKSANITQETISILGLENNNPNKQTHIPNLETNEKDKSYD